MSLAGKVAGLRAGTALVLAAIVCAAAPQAAAQAPLTGPAAAQADGLRGLEAMTRAAAARLDAANATPALKGSGPFPARLEADLALPDATIYRPADLRRLAGRKLGVLVWGNGACSNDGASAHAHLAEIASHGYLVIAPGKPLTAPGAAPGAATPRPMAITIADLRDALDWALAENGRAGSPYLRQIEPSAVAVAGHSCGGMLAILLGQDPRVKTVIIHNSGINAVIPDNPPLVLHRERLQGLHAPVLLVLGGASDVAWPWGQEAFEDLDTVPVFLGSLDVGHGGTFQQPHGGAAAQVATDWLEWRLRGDKQAARTFVGADCGLCVDPKWTVRRKGVP